MNARMALAAACGGLVGFALALVVGFETWALPLQRALDAREAEIRRWEGAERGRREADGAARAASAEELRRWVAMAEDQSRRFEEMQAILRERERELDAPAEAAVRLAAIAVLGVVALATLWARDGNAAARPAGIVTLTARPRGAAIDRVAGPREPPLRSGLAGQPEAATPALPGPPGGG